MNAAPLTWSVVATVDEPPALLQAFVAWHLFLGASEVTLCFDRPDDPAMTHFADMAQVTVVSCDVGHWRQLGRHRPHKQEVRQARNATFVYQRTTSEWLLHIDADEFLWPTVPVSECLAQADEQLNCLIVPVAERIHLERQECESIFCGVFRRPHKPSGSDEAVLCGGRAGLRQHGLTGHTVGKAFTRVGREFGISIHRPRVPDGAETELVTARLRSLELLHFDGLTPLHWIHKLLRMAEVDASSASLHRQRQMQSVLADPEMALELYQSLKVADAPLIAELETLDLVARHRFDPGDAIKRYFIDERDLSAAGFDRWLWAQKGDILRRNGFSWLENSR